MHRHNWYMDYTGRQSCISKLMIFVMKDLYVSSSVWCLSLVRKSKVGEVNFIIKDSIYMNKPTNKLYVRLKSPCRCTTSMYGARKSNHLLERNNGSSNNIVTWGDYTVWKVGPDLLQEPSLKKPLHQSPFTFLCHFISQNRTKKTERLQSPQSHLISH